MDGVTFTEITNNVAVMYGLTLIIILLMYIAFWKQPASSGSSSRRSPRHA